MVDFTIYAMPSVGSSKPTPIGIMDNYQSVIWHDKADEYGDVQIIAPLTQANLDYLKRGNLIASPRPTTLRIGETYDATTADSVRQAAIITDVTTEWTSGKITAKASDVSSLLDTRINAQYMAITNTNNAITWLKAFMTPFIVGGDRELPMSLYVPDGFEAACTAKLANTGLSYKTLTYILDKITAQNPGSGTHSTFGARIWLDLDTGLRLIPCWAWNRTQLGNDNVTFRDDMDDLDALKTEENDATASNVAFVAGEGEEDARTTAWYPADAATGKGVNRRELFVDANDLRREDYTSDDAYLSALRDRGRDKLVQVVSSIGFDVLRTDWRLGADYGLGDIVGVHTRAVDGLLALPVAETEETWSDAGYQLNLTFGTAAASFAARINKRLD